MKFIREHEKEIRETVEKRKSKFDIDKLMANEKMLRELNTKLQEEQHALNKGSMDIANAKKLGKDSTNVNELASRKKSIAALQAQANEVNKELEMLLWNLPCILKDDVPVGNSENENVELRKYGSAEKRIEKGHDEILQEMNLLDVENAAKVAGSRFFYMKGDLALLEQALIRFGIDSIIKKGYTLVAPPLMIRKKYFMGAAPLDTFKDAMYKVSETGEIRNDADYEHMEEELYMIGTAEHAIAAMHAEQVFKGSELPLRYVGISQSFRREAGSHGKDTKGIFRVHQFNKIEQFIFAKQEDSWNYLEELVRNEEEIMKALGIPYRVIELCSADTGLQVAKTYDLEAHMPSQGKYRELGSHSNCTDWQSMRLDIKYDSNNERKYVHTLNGTAMPVQRTIAVLIENYYENGRVKIPDVLVPYMNGKRFLDGLKT